jgi:hypothetical protein
MKLHGAGSRRGTIHGRGARKANELMWVKGVEKALAQVHPDPKRCKAQYSYKKERDQST